MVRNHRQEPAAARDRWRQIFFAAAEATREPPHRQIARFVAIRRILFGLRFNFS